MDKVKNYRGNIVCRKWELYYERDFEYKINIRKDINGE